MAERDLAVARVKRLGATTVKPIVDDDTVGLIVDTYPLPDPNGVRPGGAGWVPTYDTNAAIAEVYRTKAAEVSGDFNFTADDASYSKGDVLANLLAMEAKYAAMATTGNSTSSLSSALASTLEVGGTNSGLTNPLDLIASQVIP